MQKLKNKYVDITQEFTNYSNQLTIISTCTGIRGLERGIERAIRQKLRVAAYVEIEAFILANLIAGMEANILDAAPIWSDLKTFKWEDFRGKIHGIIGGYPCQPFSVAGSRNGTEDPRHLWPYLRNGVEIIKPPFVFFENVRGHLSLGFREVKSDLEQLGYRVEAGIFSAEEVGAPHRRERLFILGILDNAAGDRFKQEYQIRTGRNSSEYASEKILGDTEHNGSSITEIGGRIDSSGNNSEERKKYASEPQGASERTSNGNLQGNEELGNPQSSDKQWVFVKSRYEEKQIGGSSKNELANPDNQGFQRRFCEELRERASKCTARTSSAWPSRPGQQQRNWEAPRTTESGMGVTINGYNFREDLLRAAGNGVVEDTTELAFTTLLNKWN